MGSWEQTAQELSKWRGLINTGAALCDENNIGQAERKRREHKAKTIGRLDNRRIPWHWLPILAPDS